MSQPTNSQEHIFQTNPGLFKSWLAFMRPKTCSISISPVIASLCLAYAENKQIDFTVAFFTIALSILVILLSNMQNDLGYTQRKAEKGNRKGLPRATANGWISIKAAKRAIAIFILLALMDTFYLATKAGWGFVIVGICCITAAYCYMGGPKPLAYGPFSELIVLLFFGVIGVLGTYYLQTHSLTIPSLFLGISLGSIASSVLCVNNFRDHIHDRSIGRRTLAVLLTEKAYTSVFITYLSIPYILVLMSVIAYPELIGTTFVFITIPFIFPLVKGFKTLQGYDLNNIMFGCIKHEVRFALAYSIGLLTLQFLLG